ncbi:MAG: proline dehydrogenase family protein, partial [Planctomycetota bacterium]
MGADSEQLDLRTFEYGERFFALTGENAPSLFSRERWVGVLMDWIVSREPLKAEVFALIEALPSLTTEKLLAEHITRAFLRSEVLPPVLRVCLRIANLLGPLGRKLTSLIVRKCVKTVALQFIVAGRIDKTVARLAKIRKSEGFAFTVHVLGEETRTEEQLARYVDTYLQLLAALRTAQQNFKPLASKKRGQEPFLVSSGKKGAGAFSTLGESDSQLDWGSSPKVNISVKPSALDAQADPEDLEGTVARMLERIRPVYRAVMELGGFLCIDAETFKLREITLELYRRLRCDAEFRDYPHLGLAVQTYFTDADVILDRMLDWARRENLPIAIRLVKGAYWDSEVALAQQAGVAPPVYTTKAET